MAIEKKMWGDDTKEVKPEEDRVNTGYKAVDDPNKHVTKADEGRDNNFASSLLMMVTDNKGGVPAVHQGHHPGLRLLQQLGCKFNGRPPTPGGRGGVV